MKVLVLSDSHGSIYPMESAIEKCKPDMIIHLGDCIEDARTLQSMYPHIPMEMVPGNCDCSMEPQERILMILGHPIMICHGHTRRVKVELGMLERAAVERGVEVALFGHTHQPLNDWRSGIRICNPGSIGAPIFGNPPSYAVMTLEEETIRIDMAILE